MSLIPIQSDLNHSMVDLIPALRAFARTLHRDIEGADDLVQETLTRAIANIDHFTQGHVSNRGCSRS